MFCANHRRASDALMWFGWWGAPGIVLLWHRHHPHRIVNVRGRSVRPAREALMPAISPTAMPLNESNICFTFATLNVKSIERFATSTS